MSKARKDATLALSKHVPSSYIKLLRKLKDSLKVAFKLNHRRMVVLSGSDFEKQAYLLAKTVLVFYKYWKSMVKMYPRIAYFLHKDMPKERMKAEIVSEILKAKTKKLEFELVDYKDSEEYLGTTYDMLILDLTSNLKPNDIGRLIGIVRGGGLVVILIPEWDEWEKTLTLFQRELATPQHPENEVRQIFKKWFKRKLLEHRGIFIYNVDKRKTIKTLKEELPEKASKKEEMKMPEKTVYPRELYNLALTQDQINVLKLTEKFIEKPRGRKLVLVLTANRGRGKSCALGIAVAGFINELRKVKNRARVLVTAPKPANVQSFMMLLMKSLDKLKLKYRVIERRRKIIEVKAERFSVEYWEPINIPKMKADLVVVDEAAGLQVPMLLKIWKEHKRIMFSSTIHGYEGAGRGFSIRFLKYIKSDPKTDLIEYEMIEPIRYSENDPIEKWQFDTLLLDAEPEKLTPEDLKHIEEGNLIYVKPDLEEWFSRKGEHLLRQFFGIYVLAHYRNEPDDLGMMADAPHHTIRAVMIPSGKIVCSIQLAEEGPIPESMVDDLLRGGRIPGNIIPDRVLKHVRIREFSRTVGWRIVRIATHPDVMRKGIGSFALTNIIKEAYERGYDWVGAGFGVTEQLLRFWLKNGFLPVHMSPDRNPVSGEFTVLVLYPLSDLTKKIVEIANKSFKLKVIDALHDSYRGLETDVALLILETGVTIDPNYTPKMDPIRWDRLRIYSYGPMTYEAACDVIYELARAYFISYPKFKIKLSKIEEYILVSRVLQAKSWETTANELNKKQHFIMMKLKEIAGKIAKAYLGTKEPLGITLFDVE
ncbi:MAG: tRNA(Met) cytidine acetyltransferase [Thermoprotei archaeon]|nr:tRNA(Met) cytidine acetyltransferase [Thermoprotei archaeon]